jgi:hypothetical protein
MSGHEQRSLCAERTPAPDWRQIDALSVAIASEMFLGTLKLVCYQFHLLILDALFALR